jgi:hypothetical protein
MGDNEVQKKKSDGKEAGSIVLGATGTGLAIGTAISPGIGTAVGGMIGAVVGGTAAIINENKKG